MNPSNQEAQITHRALLLTERKPLVFAAHSAETAYLSERICSYVLQLGRVPIDPFMSLGYFMYGLVDKDSVRAANNNLLMRCDELWVFGELSDGVDAEVAFAGQLAMPVKYFDLDHYGEDIRPRRDAGSCPDRL